MNKMTRQLTQQFSVTKWFVGIMIWMMLTLSACATGPKFVDHAFCFDMRLDNPEIEVLDWQYGEGDLRYPGSRAFRYPSEKKGPARQATCMNGDLPIGDRLYVKWKIKATGEVFEQTVDLKNIDVTKQKIYFVIEGPQLYVYLISLDYERERITTEELKKARAEATTPRKKMFVRYIQDKIIQIYPAVQP